MKLIFSFFLIPCFLFFSDHNTLFDQHHDSSWKLKKEKHGIKVFTRDLVDSNLKELKIVMTFQKTSFPKILELLDKAHLYKEWMYKCSESKTVSTINDLESIAYYKFDFPWPLSDRDAYMKSVVKENIADKKLIVTTTALTGYTQTSEDVVRIDNHFNKWEFEKREDDLINLTYYLKTNPGGNIPDWAVNLAVDKGPTNSLNNFRTILEE